jgi:hypothetical protein
VKKPALAVCLLIGVAAMMAAQGIDIQSSQSDDQLRWGVQAYHRGFYSDALVSIQKSLSIKPSNLLAQIWQGRIYWKSGFEEEALKTWERLEASGNADSLLRDWIQQLRQRYGTARDVPRDPLFVKSAELVGGANGGHPFKRPSSVQPRPDGSFFLTAFGSNEVLRYDVNFRLLETMKGGLEGFNRPFDVLELPDGSLLVSEYGANKITRCTSRGEKLKSFGGTGSGNGQLLGPQYLASDGKGFVYVTDWGNSRVNKYDTDGVFILAIPSLSGPSGIAINEDRLFVSEKDKKRVSVFDTNGNFLRAIGQGTLSSPEGLSFTQGGRLLVSDVDKIWEADLENEQWRVKADTSSTGTRVIQQAMSANGDMLGVDFDENKIIFLSDPVSLYSGLSVRVDRVNSLRFPEVSVDISVQDRFGQPIVGLERNNFIITESRRSVGTTTMVRKNTDANTVDIVLLVESSPAMTGQRATAEQAASDLYASISAGGRIKAISAGDSPVKETEYGEARLRFLAAAFKGTPSSRWRFDAGARLAGDELIATAGGAKRAVVFLTSGTLGSRAYSTYSLMDLAAFMRNNAIAFYPVFLGPKALDEDLSFLASETGGKSYGVFTPGGMADVVEDIRSRTSSLYTLSYRTSSESDFGTAYIPLEVEVTMQKMSGRDECGYYAPPAQ